MYSQNHYWISYQNAALISMQIKNTRWLTIPRKWFIFSDCIVRGDQLLCSLWSILNDNWTILKDKLVLSLKRRASGRRISKCRTRLWNTLANIFAVAYHCRSVDAGTSVMTSADSWTCIRKIVGLKIRLRKHLSQMERSLVTGVRWYAVDQLEVVCERWL